MHMRHASANCAYAWHLVRAVEIGLGDAVGEAGDAGFHGAAGAAEAFVFGFDAVADDSAAAVAAAWGEGVDGAFEAVEGVGFSGDGDGEGFVVVVSADFAGGHG